MAVGTKHPGSLFFLQPEPAARLRYLQFMNWLKATLIGYAVLTAVIGTLGYVGPMIGLANPGGKASPISMVAGVVLAAVVFGGLKLAEKKPMLGYIIVALAPVAALGQFAKKAFSEQIIWPAGIMTALSIAALLALGVGHFLDRKTL